MGKLNNTRALHVEFSGGGRKGELTANVKEAFTFIANYKRPYNSGTPDVWEVDTDRRKFVKLSKSKWLETARRANYLSKSAKDKILKKYG